MIWKKNKDNHFRYDHPDAPAYVEKITMMHGHKTGPYWVLNHPGQDPGHNQSFCLKRTAIAAFKPIKIKVTSICEPYHEVEIDDDTPWHCRPDSETYWSS